MDARQSARQFSQKVDFLKHGSLNFFKLRIPVAHVQDNSLAENKKNRTSRFVVRCPTAFSFGQLPLNGSYNFFHSESNDSSERIVWVWKV
jgi:hypothetical protein